jgi:hypothetical protein
MDHEGVNGIAAVVLPEIVVGAIIWESFPDIAVEINAGHVGEALWPFGVIK